MWLRYALVSLVLLLSIAINLPEGMLVRLGVEPNILVVTLAAIIIAGLIAHRHLLLIVLVVGCVAGANLPVALAHQWGINRDVLLATLIGLLVMPLFAGKGQ
ncbi:MAG: hypothetical protein HY080_08385 [Gammaproteobacteria bacterium]|nr:hypothetical protein [Gammaproteobacteria bacterium]